MAKRNQLDPGLLEIRHALVIENCFAVPLVYQVKVTSSVHQPFSRGMILKEGEGKRLFLPPPS